MNSTTVFILDDPKCLIPNVMQDLNINRMSLKLTLDPEP